MYSTVTGYSGVTTKIEIYFYLQQYYDGGWKNYKTWKDTVNDIMRLLSIPILSRKGITTASVAAIMFTAEEVMTTLWIIPRGKLLLK